MTEELQKLWKNGSVWIDLCTEKTINYCVKYLRKSSPFDPCYQPMSFVSNGLGVAWLDDPSSKLHVRDSYGNPNYIVYQSDGVPVALPRYYINKIFSQQERYEHLLQNRLSEATKFVKRLGKTEFRTDEDFYESSIHYVKQMPIYPKLHWSIMDDATSYCVKLFGTHIDKKLFQQDMERISNRPKTHKFIKTLIYAPYSKVNQKTSPEV